MFEKAEALGVLLVLLPGFTSAYIVQTLTVRRKQSDLDKVVEALLYTLVFYLISLPLFGSTLPLSWQPLDAAHPSVYRLVVQWWHLAMLAGLALVFGVAYAAIVNNDWLMPLLRKVNITDRSSRTSIWNDAFHDLEGYVQVGLSGDRKVMGWVRDYSDEDGVYEMFLEDASWVDRDGDQQRIDGPGIMLTQQSGIQYVMFLNFADETEDGRAGDADESVSSELA
jgi:hypothetical protein